MSTVTLSIIMPLYNVEETIRQALDSILMQEVDFIYEIIAVDDNSNDNTLNILEEYAKQYSQIIVVKHEENLKNAMAFYTGLTHAKGKYFAVLDGDDYYTVKNKLQLQVDFLNADIKEEYTAIAHKFLWQNEDYDLQNSMLLSKVSEHSYYDFLANSFYYHTSTYIYRNIFKDRVPLYFKEDKFRGDMPRTFFHLKETKGKVKVLDFIGSVYAYNSNGIFSALSAEDQKKRASKTMAALFQTLENEEERACMKPVISDLLKAKEMSAFSFTNRAHFINIFQSLSTRYTQLILQADSSFTSAHLIDSFYESIGYSELVRNNISLSSKMQAKKDTILLILANFTPSIYTKIVPLLEKYKSKEIHLLFANNELAHNASVQKFLKEQPTISCIFQERNSADCLTDLLSTILKIAPEKIYHCLDTNFALTSALIQSNLAKNTCYFGSNKFMLGLCNTSVKNEDIEIPKEEIIDISSVLAR